MRSAHVLMAVMVLHVAALAARAGGFAVELKVTDGKAEQSARSKFPVAADQMSHRVTLEVSVDAKLVATWKVTRTDRVEAKDVLVHFVVVKLDRRGQAAPALDPSRVPIESALTMDFPKDKTASGSQPFRIDASGVYLVRIEAGGDPDKPGQEDFAEIELVVK